MITGLALPLDRSVNIFLKCFPQAAEESVMFDVVIHCAYRPCLLLNVNLTDRSVMRSCYKSSLLRRGSFGGGRRKTRKMKNRGSAGVDGSAFVSILSRLRALTFDLSPIPSPYEKIRGLCGGESYKSSDILFMLP